MVRYHGWYLCESRGMRAKAETVTDNLRKDKKTLEDQTLDVSEHRSKNSPSLTWRECIKKIWKEDHEMRIISFIKGMMPIKKILKYLDL